MCRIIEARRTGNKLLTHKHQTTTTQKCFHEGNFCMPIFNSVCSFLLIFYRKSFPWKYIESCAFVSKMGKYIRVVLYTRTIYARRMNKNFAFAKEKSLFCGKYAFLRKALFLRKYAVLWKLRCSLENTLFLTKPLFLRRPLSLVNAMFFKNCVEICFENCLRQKIAF